MKKSILRSIVVFVCLSASAQKKQKVLFKIDGEPTYVSEFQELFKPDKASISSASFEENLELMVNYKLKLMQAKLEGLDTLPSIKKELNTYKADLAAPYLTDEATLQNLLQEAYNRTLERVKASHILILAKGNDTVAAYQKVKDIKEQLNNGADFVTLAVKYSEDKSVTTNKGSLGYFSAFRMVYPFESAAYNTPVGQVSEIVKTSFGYHLLKIEDKEKVKGKVKSAHIMVAGLGTAKKQRIDSVYQKLINGEDFDLLAKQYSDDKGTSQKGGDLKPFSRGDLPKPFEDVVFSMKEINSYSKPFKTSYGWHIVKYKGVELVPDFVDVKEELKRKVLSSDRGTKPKEVAFERLEAKFKVQVFEPAKRIFKSKEVYKYPKDSLQNVFISINEQPYLQESYLDYIKYKKSKSPLDYFEEYKKEKIKEYMVDHLEEENEKFRETIGTYKKGLMIFELMKLHIWDVPKEESEKVAEFYKQHIEDYKDKGTTFEEVKGYVESDYQDKIEKEWLKGLREHRKIKFKKRAVKKIKKTYE